MPQSHGDGVARRPAPLLAGWGLLVAWGTLLFFSGKVPALMPGGLLDVFHVVSMAATSLALLLCGLGGTGASTALAAGRVLPLGRVSAALVCIGTLVLGLPGVATAPAMAAVAVLTGTGVALLTVLWGAAYARRDASEVESSTLLSAVVFGASYLAGCCLPQTAAIVFIAALPVGALVTLEAACRKDAAEKPQPGRAAAQAPLQAADGDTSGVRMGKVGLGVMGASFSISVLWGLNGHTGVDVGPVATHVCVLSGLIVAGVLIMQCIVFARRLDLGVLYRWICPIICFGYLCAALLTPLSATVALACMFAAQMALNLLLWIFLAEASRAARDPVGTFGFGRFFLEGGILLGFLASLPVRGMVEGDARALALVSLGVVCILVAATMSAVADQGRVAFSDEGQPPLPALDEQVRSRCERLAGQRGLTPRELEVLVCLAMGKSLPSIRNELGIAKGTVDTHARHIYQKLDVHSREELMAAVRDA